MFEKIINKWRKKEEDKRESLPSQEEFVREKLTRYLYDEELVETLLPTFLALSEQEGFKEVWEVLDSKERQVEAISSGDWFNKESGQTTKKELGLREHEEESENQNLVDSILNKKYGEK